MVSLPTPPSEDPANAFPPSGIDHLLALHAQEIVQECLILTETQAEYIEYLVEEYPEVAARLDAFMDALAVDELADEIEPVAVPTLAAQTSQIYAPITDSALYKIRLARGCLNDTTLVTPRRSVFYNFGLTNQE